MSYPVVSKTKIPSFQGQETAARVEANKIMDTIREKNTSNKQINIVVEYLVGNVRDTIQHMVSNTTMRQSDHRETQFIRQAFSHGCAFIPANVRLGCISQTCWW